MCFGIIVLWNDFIIPRVVHIHPLASPRVLHLTDDTENCGSVSVEPVRVLRLAARCTACQLDPSQLMDVVEDLLAE